MFVEGFVKILKFVIIADVLYKLETKILLFLLSIGVKHVLTEEDNFFQCSFYVFIIPYNR